MFDRFIEFRGQVGIAVLQGLDDLVEGVVSALKGGFRPLYITRSGGGGHVID